TVTGVNVNYYGVDPTLYDHSSPTTTAGDYSGDREESLNGGDYVCGDYVHFKNRVEVTGGSGTYEFTNEFDRANTNGTSAGFETLGSVYYDDGTGAGVTLDYSDISTASQVK